MDVAALRAAHGGMAVGRREVDDEESADLRCEAFLATACR